MKKKRNNKKIDFKYNFSVYKDFLFKHKLMLFFLLFMVLVSEVKQVIDKYLFKIVIDKGTEYSAGSIVAGDFIFILKIVFIVFIIAGIINIIINWLRIHILNRLEVSMIFDLKRKFFNHLINLDQNFYTTHKTGSLISRLIRGGSAIERLDDVFIFNFVPLFFQLIVITFSLIYFDFTSALVIFVTMLLFVSYSFYIQRKQEYSNLEANKREDIEKANISDVFMNIDSIKYFGKEDYIMNRFKNLSEKTRYAFLKNWDYFKWMSSGQSFIIILGTFFIVYFPLMKFLNGTVTLGTLTFVYTIYLSLLGYMFGFVHGIRGFYRSMADFQDLFMYSKFENSIKDKKNAEILKVKNGSIEFKNVSFKYHKREVINNVSLKINPGEKIALVGHSGSGKTTLVKLLYRFYDVDKGSISIDNKNIKDFKQESLRGELSIVPQEGILFDDTIFNNISFSNLKASKKEVKDSIRFAQLDKLISEFPKKENTIVGERGIKLSGGEKQRVSIARALLADKKILVLDEATSALDSKTEHEIQKDLNRLMEGRTSIIIAHRLSTIMHADKIVVMDNGKIVQIGKHNELINQKGVYRELWGLQKGGYFEE